MSNEEEAEIKERRAAIAEILGRALVRLALVAQRVVDQDPKPDRRDEDPQKPPVEALTGLVDAAAPQEGGESQAKKPSQHQGRSSNSGSIYSSPRSQNPAKSASE